MDPIVELPDRAGVLCADPDFRPKLLAAGATITGRRLRIQASALSRLLDQCQSVSHRPHHGGRHILSPRKITGLGDIVAPILLFALQTFHRLAIRIARLTRLNCINPQTKQLRPLSPCALRQSRWISAIHRLRPRLNRLLPLRAFPPR